jgi:hypothetical protein
MPERPWFSDTVAGVIAGTKAHARLNELAQDIWKAWGAGMLDDAEAGRLSGLLRGTQGACPAAGYNSDSGALRSPSDRRKRVPDQKETVHLTRSAEVVRAFSAHVGSYPAASK